MFYILLNVFIKHLGAMKMLGRFYLYLVFARNIVALVNNVFYFGL